MEILEDFVFSNTRGAGGKYDYDVLFAGKPVRLKRGEDFAQNVKIQSVRSSLGTAANKRGLSLHSQIESTDSIVVKAVPRAVTSESPKPKAKPRAKKKPAAKKPAPEQTTGGGINADALAA